MLFIIVCEKNENTFIIECLGEDFYNAKVKELQANGYKILDVTIEEV